MCTSLHCVCTILVHWSGTWYFFFSKILFCTKFNCSMSCTLALLNRRMLVRHAMAYVGILRMEAICWRYGESRRTAIFQNKPEVSYATCPRVRDLLVTRIPYLSPWTIVLYPCHHDKNKNAPKCDQWVWGIVSRKYFFFFLLNRFWGPFGAFPAFWYYLDRNSLMFFRYGFSDFF